MKERWENYFDLFASTNESKKEQKKLEWQCRWENYFYLFASTGESKKGQKLEVKNIVVSHKNFSLQNLLWMSSSILDFFTSML